MFGAPVLNIQPSCMINDERIRPRELQDTLQKRCKMKVTQTSSPGQNESKDDRNSVES